MTSLIAVAVAQLAQSQMAFMQGPGTAARMTAIGDSITSEPPKSPFKPTVAYPKFNQFFESLPDATTSLRDIASILITLTDAAIYHIDELDHITDEELRKEGLKLGDVEWLRAEVRRVMKAHMTTAN